MYICCDDFRIECFPGILGPKQFSANSTAGAITADHVFGLFSLPVGSLVLDVHPRLALILSQAHNLVPEFHRSIRLLKEMCVHQRKQLAQRQGHCSIPVVLGQGRLTGVDARDERRICFPPRHAPEMKPLGTHIIQDTGTIEFVGGRGSVVKSSRLLVQFATLLQNFDLDALLGEQDAQKEACGAGTDNYDL